MSERDSRPPRHPQDSRPRRPFPRRNASRPPHPIPPIDIWRNLSEATISCPSQNGPILSQELATLGYTVCGMNTPATMVGITGLHGMRDIFRLNLTLRTANRVLIPVGKGPARDLDGLKRLAGQIPWEAYLDPERPVLVNSTVENQTVRDSRVPNLRAKDAITARMRYHCGRKTDADDKDLFADGACVYFYWEGDFAKFYLDTTGRPLAKRGYHKAEWRGNINEATSAAALLAGGWDASSPLAVPMCGCGTVAIEAALMARRRAPGLLRSVFAFQMLKGFGTIIPGERLEDGMRCRFGASPEQIWRQVVREIEQETRTEGLPAIVASDKSLEAIAAARRNALAAGVASDICFEVCDFADTALPSGAGTIFLNPDAGDRPAGEIELEPVYRRMGAWFKAHPEWTALVLSGSPELAKRIGLEADQAVELVNGARDCRLLVYGGRGDELGR
ncbi:MAG: hypothetical protein SPK06_04855 [Kiritimatiellia bacterium]|nr:hypothetical protein [Kiritimatiellia bacterium]